jgi:pimeloyl-ACP methyl ester carboxylesterase
MKSRTVPPKPIHLGYDLMATQFDTLPRDVEVGPNGLRGLLGIPDDAHGLVIFAHGSGSGRLSPRNNYVAEALREHSMATLLLDLLTPREEESRANVFDIPLLARRLSSAAHWARLHPALHHLPIGYFGASTGAAAALVAAAGEGAEIAGVVSRGGRPDLAGTALPLVVAPTLLLVGSLDGPVIQLNQQAYALMSAPKQIVIIPGAGHLFEEPGTLDLVIDHATRWFGACFANHRE